MSRLTNYYNLGQGETFDLLYIDFVEGFPNGQIKFMIPDTPRKVTGVQKVIQTFLYYLFTRKGTDLLDGNKGTYFSDFTMYSNRTGSSLAVHTQVDEAIKDAQAQTQAVLNASETSPTSLLKSVEIVYLDTTSSSTDIYLKITTEAGDAASVSIPFPQTNLQTNA